MATKLFLNMPVKDLDKSMAFFKELGFSFNMNFTDEKGACLVLADGSIYAMLLTEAFFQTFTKKEVANAHKTSEVLIGIDAASREEVKSMVSKAIEAGGKTTMEPMDHGWMYQESFADLDGHQWEVLYIDESAVPSS